MRVLLVLGSLLLAGCASSATTGAGSAVHSSGSSSAGASPSPASSTSAPSTPAATLQHPIPASSTSTGPLRCAQRPPYQVTIYKGIGLVTCLRADAMAAKYDRSGGSVQHIDGYTCQSGTATTRPVVFTCSSTEAEFTAADAVGPQTCPKTDKYRIRIVSGQITCTIAADVAAQYRTQGPSVQRIDGYTCQSGNAMTRPTVFTCTATEAEFAVDQP